MTSDSEPLRYILLLIHSGSVESNFDQVALRLFQYQFRWNAPYHRFCVGRGKTPENVRTWQEIPAAPASAFKHFDLTCTFPEACTPRYGGRVFHSSGTTGAETSCHYMDRDALICYTHSLTWGYRQAVHTRFGRLPIFAFMPPPDEAPHSSLSFMLQVLIELDGGKFFWGEGWTERLQEALQTRTKPITLFGTAFAWVHFLDSLTAEIALPAGSVVVETGGFKGRSREISRDELYALFTERLGVPPDHCLSEYGMSEMASQFYSVANGPKIAPPWVRYRVFNPVTGDDALPGEPGLLAYYDLANLNSCLALQTEDLGTLAPEGGFHLLGRASGAILRGCSLTAEGAFFSLQNSHHRGNGGGKPAEGGGTGPAEPFNNPMAGIPR